MAGGADQRANSMKARFLERASLIKSRHSISSIVPRYLPLGSVYRPRPSAAVFQYDV